MRVHVYVGQVLIYIIFFSLSCFPLPRIADLHFFFLSVSFREPFDDIAYTYTTAAFDLYAHISIHNVLYLYTQATNKLYGLFQTKIRFA